MKKLLFFFIFFSLLSSELVAVQEDFFCRNLKKEIIQTRDAKDLSSPEISTFMNFNFFQKMELDLESFDWKNKFDCFKDIVNVIYFPRTENVSTTKIINNIKYS